MNAGHGAMLGLLRPVCLLAVITAGLTGQPGAGSGRTVARVTPHQASLTSLTLTSTGSDGQPADAASSQADVAAGGGYAAFQSRAALHVTASVPQTGAAQPGVSSVYVHGLVTGTTTLLSDAANGDATAPAISADGRLVSYEQNGDVYLAGRQASGSAGTTPRAIWCCAGSPARRTTSTTNTSHPAQRSWAAPRPGSRRADPGCPPMAARSSTRRSSPRSRLNCPSRRRSVRMPAPGRARPPTASSRRP